MPKVNETFVTGKRFRMWDEVSKVWQRISFWTSASDVELKDGTDLETEVEDIKGSIDRKVTSGYYPVNVDIEMRGDSLYITTIPIEQ